MPSKATNWQSVEKDVMDIANLVDSRMTDLDIAAPGAAFPPQGISIMSGFTDIGHAKALPRLQSG